MPIPIANILPIDIGLCSAGLPRASLADDSVALTGSDEQGGRTVLTESVYVGLSGKQAKGPRGIIARAI